MLACDTRLTALDALYWLVEATTEGKGIANVLTNDGTTIGDLPWEANENSGSGGATKPAPDEIKPVVLASISIAGGNIPAATLVASLVAFVWLFKVPVVKELEFSAAKAAFTAKTTEAMNSDEGASDVVGGVPLFKPEVPEPDGVPNNPVDVEVTGTKPVS
jgi:hypothetical protein